MPDQTSIFSFVKTAVNDFFKNKSERKKVIEELKSIADLERLVSKVATGKAVPRDIVQLKISQKKISEIKKKLEKFSMYIRNFL